MAYRKKDRPLTEILQRQGETLVETGSDSPVRAKELLAQNVWALLTQGRVTFPDGREVKASVKDWKDAAQWLYNHCDGPFKLDAKSGDDRISATLSSMSSEDLQAVVRQTADRIERQSRSESAEDADT